MTVSYTGDVANGSSFGCFWKILGRWRGSVYKLIWRELIAYLFLYFTINAMYRLGMTEDQRRVFERVKVYCSKQIESIPMSFVLGFYVTLIVKRWWDQYWILPMPDSLALYISAALQGQDERGRLLRRTIMRYAMMAYVICLQRISFRVKKRFPTLQHLVDTGLMTESEKKVFDLMDQKTKVIKFWMPVVWAGNLVNRARLEGRIHSDHMVQTIITELSDFRRKLGRVMVYDTVSVPLVYTQVVTLAVYTYFLAALIGRQWVNPPNPSQIYPNYELDLKFPIFLSLQFIFYIGWLKVAETLINPFGEDDDDFELNWLIDRHIKVSYMVVDEMHEEHPELLKDQYWEQVVPEDLPYNIASERFRRSEPQGSTASLKVKPSESLYADLTSVKRHSVIPDEVYADYESVAGSPLPDSRKTWIQRQWSRVGSLRSISSSSSRNRQGPLPLTMSHSHYNHPGPGGHRPSLYERILSRRSSKETRNSSRYKLNGTLAIGKEGNYTLMPNPNPRPRAPTPDVSKETNSPVQPVSHRAGYSNEGTMTTPTVTNPGYGSQSSSTFPQVSLQPPPLPRSPRLANATLLQSGTIGKREMLPPPYDSSPASTPPPIHTGTALSPIAENDGSPYSTSSTNRSNRSSSSYPTTTSIFGRKPSPPPLQEDSESANNVSTTKRGSSSSGHSEGGRRNSLSSNNSSTKSQTSSSTGKVRLSKTRRMSNAATKPYPSPSFSGEASAIDELEAVLKETVFDGRMNAAFVHDEDDTDSCSRDYMTIAEVIESRANLQNNVEFKGPQETPPTLPQPRVVIPPVFTVATVPIQLDDHKEQQSTSKPQKPEPSSSTPTTASQEEPEQDRNVASPDLEADDGYDEKGSYNDDDDFATASTSNNGNDTPSTSTLNETTTNNENNDAGNSTSPPPEASTSKANNDMTLLLSPKGKRKPRDREERPQVSKDCEVFV